MKLEINDYQTIAALQEKFSRHFRQLKIEFYTAPHGCNERSCYADVISPDKHVGEIRTGKLSGSLTIKDGDTVAAVEDALRKRFGLNAQVFRKEACGWVQTSGTDSFTLEQQEEMAEYSNHSLFARYKEEYNDYDEL